MGSSQQALAAMVRAFQGSGRGDLSAASKLAATCAGDACQGGFVLDEQAKQVLAARGDVPAWVQNATGAAFGVSVSDGLSVEGMVDLGDSAAAEQAVAEATQALDEAKQAMGQPDNFAAMMMTPFKPLIDGLTLAADGSVLRVSIKVSQTDVDALAQNMGQMMGGMAGGGGMPGGSDVTFTIGE
jgi:hypothetical protein